MQDRLTQRSTDRCNDLSRGGSLHQNTVEWPMRARLVLNATNATFGALLLLIAARIHRKGVSCERRRSEDWIVAFVAPGT